MWGCCWWPGCVKVMPGQASSLCILMDCMCGCNVQQDPQHDRDGARLLTA